MQSMGIGNLEKMQPTHETPTEILELVRMSVIETLQADFYHSPDEHAKSAIELHKKVAKKYPNFYLDVFSDPDFTDYFLDAHKIMSLPYILQDEENIDLVLKNLLETQPNRLEDIYRICKMQEMFGISVPTRILRKLFLVQSKYLENEKGKDYIGFIGVKYASGIKNIMATTRTKNSKLSSTWQEVMQWVFNKSYLEYSTPVMQEASKLRNLVKSKKPLDFKPKNIPFTVWQGYAKSLGLSEEEIFKQYKLMTKNETRRYLNTLQKYGILDSQYHKQKIKSKVMKTRSDLLQLFYGIKVLDNKAKEILLKKGKQEFDTIVTNLQKIIENKKITISVDCSGGCAGHTNMLNPDIQKKIVSGESIPNWAKIIQRETFNANVLIAKVLSDASKSSKVYLFNESVQETELPSTFESLVEELKKVQCSGGSNILDAVKSAIESNPDIAFIITDLNENVPFQGALKSKLEEIAKSFSGTIIFVITETIVERPDALQLDKIIRDKKLFNVFLIPVRQLGQLEKGFTLIKLLEKAKKVFVTSKKKKKVIQ